MRPLRIPLVVALGVLLAASAWMTPLAPAATVGPVTDPVGVVRIARGQPLILAYWLVVAGPDASLGIDSRRGIEIAIDDKGGRLLGHPIRLIGEDSGCNAEGGVTAATKLAANRQIVAAIGSSCSSEAVPGAPILWKAGIVTVSPSNTAPRLTDPKRGPDYDGYLRTAHNDLVQGRAAAQFVYHSLGLRRAATIHDGSPYAEGLANVFADVFKRLGGTITSQEAIAPTDTDMRPVLTRIAAGRPQLIYYPIFIAAGGHVTRQAKEVAGLEQVKLMSADGTFSPDFWKAAGDAAKGVYQSSPDLSVEALGPKYREFLNKHQRKYGEKPLSAFHAHAYDAASIIFAAIEKVARKDAQGNTYIGRKALRDALFATRNFPGITGTLTCNPHGDCADPKIAVYQTISANPAQWNPGTDPKLLWSMKR
jgi:branched-chain amino acid transport system substrate-binding protein